MKLETFAAAKVIIPHPKENKLLLVSRIIDSDFAYEPAGGRIDTDFKTDYAENFEQCAIREAKEELNLDIRIQNYLGSYYFFWNNKSNNSRAFTACTVFLAESISDIKNLSLIGDLEMNPVYPKWIDIDEILADKIPFREGNVGLKKLVMNAANVLSKHKIVA